MISNFLSYLVVTAYADSDVLKSAIQSASIDFTKIFGEIVSLLPIVLPVVISMIALRKGLAFLMKTLKGS